MVSDRLPAPACDLVNAGTLVILGAALAAALWAAYHIVVSRVRRYLIKATRWSFLWLSFAIAMRRSSECARCSYRPRSTLGVLRQRYHDFRQRVHAMKLSLSPAWTTAFLRPQVTVARLAGVIDELETYDRRPGIRSTDSTLQPRRSTVRLQDSFNESICSLRT
jgi:hypothetical protein